MSRKREEIETDQIPNSLDKTVTSRVSMCVQENQVQKIIVQVTRGVRRVFTGRTYRQSDLGGKSMCESLKFPLVIIPPKDGGDFTISGDLKSFEGPVPDPQSDPKV